MPAYGVYWTSELVMVEPAQNISTKRKDVFGGLDLCQVGLGVMLTSGWLPTMSSEFTTRSFTAGNG